MNSGGNGFAGVDRRHESVGSIAASTAVGAAARRRPHVGLAGDIGQPLRRHPLPPGGVPSPVSPASSGSCCGSGAAFRSWGLALWLVAEIVLLTDVGAGGCARDLDGPVADGGSGHDGPCRRHPRPGPYPYRAADGRSQRRDGRRRTQPVAHLGGAPGPRRRSTGRGPVEHRRPRSRGAGGSTTRWRPRTSRPNPTCGGRRRAARTARSSQ